MLSWGALDLPKWLYSARSNGRWDLPDNGRERKTDKNRGGKMTPEQIVKYFIWYCHNIMDYSQMSEFYGDPYPGYIDEKWMSFRK